MNCGLEIPRRIHFKSYINQNTNKHMRQQVSVKRRHFVDARVEFSYLRQQDAVCTRQQGDACVKF